MGLSCLLGCRQEFNWFYVRKIILIEERYGGLMAVEKVECDSKFSVDMYKLSNHTVSLFYFTHVHLKPVKCTPLMFIKLCGREIYLKDGAY